MIYVAEILDSKFIKIGFSASNDVQERISSLQTGNPFQIKPVFTIAGTLRQEKTIHAALNVAFGRIRIPIPPNEWYPGKHPFMQDFLSALKYGVDTGLSVANKYPPCVKQPGKKGNIMSPNLKWPSIIERQERKYMH